jgi:hypothetical protein
MGERAWSMVQWQHMHQGVHLALGEHGERGWHMGKRIRCMGRCKGERMREVVVRFWQCDRNLIQNVRIKRDLNLIQNVRNVQRLKLLLRHAIPRRPSSAMRP